MDRISSRWRKPKCRSSKKKQIAANKAKARWSKNHDNALSVNINASDILNTVDTTDIPSTSGLELNQDTSRTNADTLTYAFINMNIWNNLLENVKCSECLCSALSMNLGNSFGLAAKFEIKCNECGKVCGSSFSSPRLPEMKQFEINKKIVEAFLRIGKGHAALEMFSLVLGIQAMDKKTFSKCLNSLSEDGKDIKREMLELSRNIVRQRHEDIDPTLKEQSIINISVSYDGTWHKRGHTSIYGLGIVIDVLTGLVIDYEVLSKYCPE